MNFLFSLTNNLDIPPLLRMGIVIILAFYLGKSMKFIKLPSIIGFMIVGVIFGPSLFGIINHHLSDSLNFLTEMSLGFVALSIGLELNIKIFKKQGPGMMLVILAESFLAFFLVTIGIYALTDNLPLALIMGGIAPASAPAGTIAVIHEYKASGSLTKALYTVVGFDDGLGIIIYGFAAAFSKSLILKESNMTITEFMNLMKTPFMEVVLSIVIGIIFGVMFCMLLKRLNNPRDIYVMLFGMVLFFTGLSGKLHLSFILTNMVVGMVIENTQKSQLIEKIRSELNSSMPLLFVLFFVLAGVNLHIEEITSLGVLGGVYILLRSVGLISGAWIGATVGRLEDKIRKYLGLGILSQAGVAIGLALITKQEFAYLGPDGVYVGTVVITTVTATSLVFEVIGPILTRIALLKSGEIKQ